MKLDFKPGCDCTPNRPCHVPPRIIENTVYVIPNKSVTLDKLGDDVIEYIGEHGGGGTGEIVTDKPLVVPELTCTWTNVQTGQTSTDLNINAEWGFKYNWSGRYRWQSNENNKNPERTFSSVFGVNLPPDGQYSNTVTRSDIFFNSKFGVEFYAKKVGYEVVDDKIIEATGEDQTETYSSITFLYPTYAGVDPDSLTKTLRSSATATFTGVTTQSYQYFTYKYPVTFKKLTNIIMNDSYDVTEAFNYTEESMTLDSGQTIDMRVYTSANPGAFTNAKLNFK